MYEFAPNVKQATSDKLKCAKCQIQLSIGDNIKWEKNNKQWWHEACADNAGSSSAPISSDVVLQELATGLIHVIHDEMAPLFAELKQRLQIIEQGMHQLDEKLDRIESNMPVDLLGG